MGSLFTALTFIGGYLDEIIEATPDAITLVKDTVRAYNDFRAGKYTPDEFSVAFDDLKKVALDLFAPPPATPAA